jgi:hypothetical protein
MNTKKTRWATMAGLIVAGAAMASVGCGSSSSASGTGGTTGTGGGSGGTLGGTGGAAVIHKISYTFDADKQGWILGTYADPTAVNLAGNYATADGGTDAGDAGSTDGGTAAVTPPTLDWDGSIGNPALGSLKLTATFTTYGQYVDAIFQTLMPTVDLHAGQLHGKLQITSVSTSSFMGGAQLHASTGTTYDGYAKADFVLAPMGSFATATIDMSTQLPPVDPTVVIQVGIQIFSGTLLPTGTPLPAPQTIVFNIDTVTD